MRIIQLGPYPPPYGGVQANIVAIREYLVKLGVPNGVINLTRHRKETGDGIFYPNTAAETAGFLFKLPARILHLHIGGHVPLRVAVLALLVATIPGRRSVLTFHSGGYPSTPEGREAKAASFLGFVFQRFDRVIVVNQELAAMFRRFGVAEDRIRLILPHYVDPNEVAASFPGPMQRFFAEHDPVISTVGLLETEYDLPLQIDVLGRVRERFPNAGLIISGSGSLEDELRQKIGSVPYAKHILLTGDISHSVALRLIRDSRIFLRTTLYDGDAVSVREALFLGTPLIATDNGMRPEGPRLIPISDGGALEQAIIDELLHGPARKQAAEGGMQNLQQVFELYEELDPKLPSYVKP